MTNAQDLSGAAAGASREVRSNQTTPHERLIETVEKHAARAFRKPYAAHSEQTFAELQQIRATDNRPVVLDSGCGTGVSTRRLALIHPGHLVIGIDKSAVRLGKSHETEMPPNCHTVRGDVVDLWRLMHERGWPRLKHYLLYPNPWPKSKHLKRRWHGHPVFPTVLAISESIELRTNWRIYAEEFCIAVSRLGAVDAALKELEGGESLTPFETKYRASGHRLYRVSITLRT